MTVEQALENIDQALASVNANRQVHDALVKCLEVIRQALKEKEK